MNNKVLLIITVGIPGAGKTTWAKRYISAHPGTIYISNDDLREELTGTTDFSEQNAQDIYDEAEKRVQECLKNNKNVILDGTHTNMLDWNEYKNFVATKDTILIAKLFDVTPDQAEQNLKFRKERPIPKDVLVRKWSQLEKSKKLLPLFFNWVDDQDFL